MRKSNFALRLQPSLLAEARKVAESEGVALNQLINVALAEKLSAFAHGGLLRRTGGSREYPRGAPHPRPGGCRAAVCQRR